MKGWNLFGEIKQYKEMGLNKSQVQRALIIGYNTVDKYWDMSNDEYAQLINQSKNRSKKMDKYKDQILEWVTDFRDMSSAQVFDWIKERYGEVNFKERSLRHYISNLRKQYNLPKVVSIRQFEEVPETPIGFQAQVDMGQIWLKKITGGKVKVYCFAMVLSHSRFKYILWSDRPFTTLTFIDAHNRAFEYLGGIPKEMVYDQDRVLAVSENFGDIIYTEGFQNYIDIMKYKVRLCRGFDPQSKGKIEAVVKYAKYNFAINRTFIDIGIFNEDSFKWLDRTGNRKKHEITKKVPAEVFTLEKEHLLPIPQLFGKNSPAISLTYGVRKNNIVLYKQSRYQVPKGTYSPGRQVNIIANGTKINIIDAETGELIINHQIITKQGALRGIGKHDKDRISTTNPDIDKDKSINNIELISCDGTYNEKFKDITTEMRIQHEERMQSMRSDRITSFEKSLNTSKSDVACEMIFTSDEEFFKGMNKTAIKKWAETSLDFVINDIGLSKSNIIHAIVHLDEKTPHLHVVAVPLVETYDGRRKENVLKISRAKYIPDKIALSSLQDRYNEKLIGKGYKLNKGSVGAKKEHKTTAEFKEEQLQKLERKLTFTKNALKRDDKELSSISETISDIDSIKGKESLIGNNITLRVDDFKKLKELAKNGVYSASKVKEIERKYGLLAEHYDYQKKSKSEYLSENSELRKIGKTDKKNIDILKTQREALVSVVKAHDLIGEAEKALKELTKPQEKSRGKDLGMDR